MNYEAILIDQQRGHHRRAVAQNPMLAVLKAFRQILKVKASDDTQWPIIKAIVGAGPDGPVFKELTDPKNADEVQIEHIAGFFCTVLVDDENMENPKTLKEEPNDVHILVRIDRTKENMYCPCGIIRPVF